MFNLALVALVVFYLFLLVRPQYVKRQFLFMIGFVAVLVAMLGGFFSPIGATCAIFSTIGTMAAFLLAFGACYGGELPINISIPGEDKTQPK